MRKFTAAVIAAVILLSGCGNTDETYRPENRESSPAKSSAAPEPPRQSSAEAASAAVSTRYVGSVVQSPPPEDNDPHELVRTLTDDGSTLTFTLENLFSEGSYYTVTVSAEKTDKDGAYKTPVMTLLKYGEPIDSVYFTMAAGERFLILESADDNSSTYGSEVISNMRDFDAAEYPDVLGLVFEGGSAEAAVPSYARYFAVFGGKLTELPIYDGGVMVKPRGVKLEPVSAGLTKQYLTVLKSSGSGYEIIKYEYRFDVPNKRLNRQQVRFYGFDY